MVLQNSTYGFSIKIYFIWELGRTSDSPASAKLFKIRDHAPRLPERYRISFYNYYRRGPRSPCLCFSLILLTNPWPLFFALLRRYASSSSRSPSIAGHSGNSKCAELERWLKIGLPLPLISNPPFGSRWNLLINISVLFFSLSISRLWFPATFLKPLLPSYIRIVHLLQSYM